MLGLYTNFNNNTYLNQNYSNQNYGYGQSVMNPYQQQSNFFGGYSTGYGQQSSYLGGYQQQQPAYDMNSMIFSLISSLLPAMFGLLGNRQPVQRPVAQQPPVASTVPVTSNISNVINGNSGQNNIFNTIINIILNSGQTPVTVDEETIEITSKEPKKVYIVGSYATAGESVATTGHNDVLTLEENIKDFSGIDEGITDQWGNFAGVYSAHKYFDLQRGGTANDLNNEEFQKILSKMSDADKQLKFDQGQAYVIDEDGKVIDTISSNQLGDNSKLSFWSKAPTFSNNSNFKVLGSGLGLEDDGSNTLKSWSTNQESEGGKIELNGQTYEVSSTILRKHSPLTFDLNGDGVKTSNKVISYDIDGDGDLDKINDVADGTLSIRGGKDGKDLFGDNTDLDNDGKADGFSNGFEALKALAAKEGLINGKDDMKLDEKDLKILEDKYQLGMKTDGYNSKEKSLESLGITEINLGNTDKVEIKDNFDGQDNLLMSQAGSTFKINGEEREYADVWHTLK